MAKYQISVTQSGNQSTSVVGDQAQVISYTHASTSLEEFMTVLKALREELNSMAIPAAVREEAVHEVDRAIEHAKNTPPDKPKLLDMLKKVADTVKKSSSIASGVGRFWTLLRKAMEWLV